MTIETAFPEVEIKAVRNATISVDKAEGIVEAFAAAIGNKDSVGDIIVPGAFAKSLQRRKPRVVWGHNWNEPIGKVLEISEVTSSDPRLPAKMKSAGVGGLFVKVQFNLASERGKEAFASVLFFGEDQEWSIGYKTLVGEQDPVRGANLLREVELYEVSPVLHGANNLTGTISVKDATTDGDLNSSTSTGDYTIQYTPSTTGVQIGGIEEKKYFDGHTYPGGDPMPEEDDESDERRMIRKAFTSALGNATGLKFVDDDKVVFEKPGEGTWMSKYRRDGRMIRMTRPVRARSQVVYVPIEVSTPGPSVAERAPSPTPRPMVEGAPKPDTCSCGNPMNRRYKDDDEKSGEPEDLETKVGRVLSNANMGKLRQASELLNSVVNAGMPPEKPTMEDGAEEKKELTGKIAHLAMKADAVGGFLDSISDSTEKYGWDVDGEGADGEAKVDIHFATDDDMAEQVKELAAAVESLDSEVSVSVEKKDI